VSAVRSRWAHIALASAALAGTLEVTGVHSPLRPAVMVWFVLVCPGVAIVRLLRLEDAVAELALAVALSIALAMAVGGIALYSGLWAPGATLAILIAITIGAAAAPLARARRGQHP
jgi:uncharacterized membrane protein